MNRLQHRFLFGGIRSRSAMKITAIFFLLVAVYLLPLPASGDEGIEWDAPVRMTSEDSVVQYSAVAADLHGNVHVFWAYKPQTDDPANLLFYRYHDANGWSDATDLFAGPDWDLFSRPSVLVDETNQLHLIWHGVQGLYYSSAQADEASDPRNWQAASRVAQVDALGTSDLEVTSDGFIHVVYTQNQPGSNVMYTRSEDKGASWTLPEALSVIPVTDAKAPSAVTIVADPQETLHVVWHESHPPQYLGRQVFYSRSLDGGDTWAEPLPLSSVSEGEAWNALPSLVVDAEERLHIMWACGAPVARCYRASRDGGESWTDVSTPTFPPLIGSSGRDAVAADPHGKVYWAGSLRYPQAFYLSTLSDNSWRVPPQPLIVEGQYGGLSSAHFPEMVISQGNQLHLVMVEFDGGPLWYLHGVTSSPAIPATVVERQPTATAVAVSESLSMPTQTPTPVLPDLELTRPQESSGAAPLITAIVTVVGLLVIVVVASITKRR